MSDKRITLLTEGDDDKATLSELQKCGLVDLSFEIKKRNTRGRGGIVGMLKDAEDTLAAGKSVVVVRDFDDLDPDGIGKWIDHAVREAATTRSWAASPVDTSAASQRVHALDIEGANGKARIAGVAVGLRDDSEKLAPFGIERFALDDCLLLLIADPAVYEEMTELKAEVPHTLAMSKLAEIKRLMDDNGLPLRLSKRFLQLLRAITGFRASPAEFAEGLIVRAIRAIGPEGLRPTFQPLLEDLDAAAQLITSR